jgi:hypothetical protein
MAARTAAAHPRKPSATTRASPRLSVSRILDVLAPRNLTKRGREQLGPILRFLGTRPAKAEELVDRALDRLPDNETVVDLAVDYVTDAGLKRLAVRSHHVLRDAARFAFAARDAQQVDGHVVDLGQRRHLLHILLLPLPKHGISLSMDLKPRASLSYRSLWALPSCVR